MKSIKFNKSQSLHRTTAEIALQRAMQFLRTVGTDPAIRTQLQKVGFELADLKQGWALVLKACSAPQASPRFTPNDGPVAEVTQQIEAWQSTMFLRAHAALRRLHPEQDAFVFENLVSGTGPASVVAVSLFLKRIDALESSPERKSTRKADHAALATIERRGVTKEEIKRAKELVHVVENTAAPEVEAAQPTDERMAALAEVYAWVQDWSDCARSVITRRDQLLRLGIGKRKARSASVAQPEPTPVPSPVVPQIVTTPIAALAANRNGMTNGAIAMATGGLHD
jgi:hypothetical protein